MNNRILYYYLIKTSIDKFINFYHNYRKNHVNSDLWFIYNIKLLYIINA